MLYRCRVCNYEEARGWLPTATCGMLLLVQMGIVIGLLIPVIRYMRSLARETYGVNPQGTADIGWWALVIAPLSTILVIVATILGAIILNTVLELLEWLVFSLRRCPKCGCRRWSWGFTRGFGL